MQNSPNTTCFLSVLLFPDALSSLFSVASNLFNLLNLGLSLIGTRASNTRQLVGVVNLIIRRMNVATAVLSLFELLL